MTLPILISIPHAGLHIPPEAAVFCCLTESEIIADSDEGAAEIYDLADHVTECATTDVARAIVDLNRADDDRRPDGVVKTVTIWNVPVYREPLPDDVVTQLLERYYFPYHHQLENRTNSAIKLCVDCHTMAAVAPPIGPNPGVKRPAICLGDLGGRSLPANWINTLERLFRDEFVDFDVTVNIPFSGGYITQRHSQQRPWFQLEISREPFLSNDEKRAGVLRVLNQFCNEMF